MKKYPILCLCLVFAIAIASCAPASKRSIDGVYKFYLWHSMDEDMCFEFKDGELFAFSESAPETRESVDFVMQGDTITLTKDQLTLIHDNDYLYYDSPYLKADLGDQETFDFEAELGGYFFFQFHADGTCQVGVISPGGEYEVYGTGEYTREGRLIKLTFGETYPYFIASESYFYYHPDEGRIYLHIFIKKR